MEASDFWRSGFTLLEIMAVLTIFGVGLSFLLPAARHQVDRLAVVGAREELVGLFHRTRMEAVARGGARIHLSVLPPHARIVADEGVLTSVDLGRAYGVVLELSRAGVEAELLFDGLGLGRISSQTITIRKGEETARIYISSYGRVRRE